MINRLNGILFNHSTWMLRLLFCVKLKCSIWMKPLQIQLFMFYITLKIVASPDKIRWHFLLFILSSPNVKSYITFSPVTMSIYCFNVFLLIKKYCNVFIVLALKMKISTWSTTWLSSCLHFWATDSFHHLLASLVIEPEPLGLSCPM